MKMRAAGSRFVGLLIAALVCVLHFTGFAEASTTWMKTYYFDGNSSFDPSETGRPNSIQTADGGYVVVGHKSAYRYLGGSWRPRDEALVFKVDARGELAWQMTYLSPGDHQASTIQPTADGGFIVAGVAKPYLAASNAWLFKLDGSGNMEWQKTYRGLDSGASSATSVRQTADGGFIMAGWTGPSFLSVMVWKLDVQGNIEWQKVYNSSTDSWNPKVDVRQTSDGGYVVAGNNWLGKLTAAGEITWQKTCQIPSVASFAAFSVLQTHDGGYAVAGVAPIPDNFTIIPYLLKFDAAGNLERQRAYNLSGLATSIELTADGGYIASGTAQYSGDWVSKLDANWNVEWEKSLARSGESSLYGVQQTADGGYLASGHVELYVPLFQRHAWLTKLDANGIVAGCASGMVADLNASQPGSAVTAVDATVAWQTVDIPPQPGTAIANWQYGTANQSCTETAPDITVTPLSLAFGNVETGSVAVGTVTVTNDVNYPLTISSISVDGADFNQTNNCATVPGFGSCSITVTFAPGSVGARSATLTIASNDPATPTVFIPLTGTGVRIMYSINASAGPNGSISPSGTVTAYTGDNRTFSIVPAAGYYIADVLVDGASVGAVTSYTFSNIRANHTIMATFSQFLSVTAPNGGESWKRGTTQTIRWTYAGNPGSYVKIELLKGGAVNSTITSKTSIGTNGSGSYNWRIPSKQATGLDYTIRVTSTSNSNYKDTSNGTFTITP